MQASDFIESRRALGSRIPAIAACCLLATPFAFSQSAPSAPGLPVLTTAAQVRRLTRSEAVRGYPVHLKVVVTYFEDGSIPELFIQDSTGSGWVPWNPNLPKAVPGQLLDLWGVTTQSDFAPDIDKPRWTVIGQAPMPPAKRVTFEEMASTAVDAHWVEVEGLVRSAEVPPNDCCLRLNLEVPGGRVVVRVLGQSTVPAGLVDSYVRIHGACGAIFTAKNQLVGVMLYVPSMQ
jgi:hypothetical protein